MYLTFNTFNTVVYSTFKRLVTYCNTLFAGADILKYIVITIIAYACMIA